MKEIFKQDSKYVNLRIVPLAMRNVVFVAFHANPIGGHFSSWATFHRIRQRFFWPGLYQYCKRMVKACPGCALSNCTRRTTDALVYSFPMDVPMSVLFVDVFTAGADLNFEGNKHYLIAACSMTSFAVGEPVPV